MTLKPCFIQCYMEQGSHHSLKYLKDEGIGSVMRESSEIMVPWWLQYTPKKKRMDLFLPPSPWFLIRIYITPPEKIFSTLFLSSYIKPLAFEKWIALAEFLFALWYSGANSKLDSKPLTSHDPLHMLDSPSLDFHPQVCFWSPSSIIDIPNYIARSWRGQTKPKPNPNTTLTLI